MWHLQREMEFPHHPRWQDITNARLRAAFERVDRARFVPETFRNEARLDEPLPIGCGQTISQPFIIAWMVQALALQPGMKVLEIGAGSGYQTAILCEMTLDSADSAAAQPVAKAGRTVYSIERLSDLAANAAKVLHSLGYFPHLRIGDGALGWHEAAPFDAIVVAAATPILPPAWFEQLAEGGRLVVPIGQPEEAQELWLIYKIDGVMQMESLGGARFVPLVSPLLESDRRK
jgi:protein-L-isoaspartate(D-aspartate) O-methyltransferase